MTRLTNRLTVVITDFMDAAISAGLDRPVAPLKYAFQRIGESELTIPRVNRRVRPTS